MNQPATAVVRVFVDLAGVTTFAGTGYVSQRGEVVSTTFDYDRSYQSHRLAYSISPDLDLAVSKHQLSRLPGAFADGAPDRWGRNLIDKRLRADARVAGRAIPVVLESDYLLGVSDETRQGALRYAIEVDGPFLAGTNDDGGVPKLIELPRLLRAADRIADGHIDGDDDLAAVKALLDAGSGSLGGARPKASVRDGDQLLIAKFPHPADDWDVMAWEKTALDLAEDAGVAVPRRRLVDVGGRRALVLDRFDRDRDRAARRGYVSARTLVGGDDSASHDYLEVAEAITEHGSSVRADLAQLWRRIAFSIVVNNTDDHLRNHGFLRARSGWLLSPAFDVNPDPDPTKARATSIGFTSDPEECLDALIDACSDFDLTTPAALDVLEEVRAAVRPWRQVAAANEISEHESKRFAGVLDRHL